MTKRCLLLSGCIALLFLLTSCATSRLEMDFGTSTRLSKINQIHDPGAEKNVEPVYGLDGKAAQANTEKYLKDFEKPVAATPSALTLGISSLDKR
ncbi:MAG: hypothetical protein ACUVWO_08805 [Thermodesulfobacteriota bacterium]